MGAANDSDLWLKDLQNGTFSRLTMMPGSENQTVWSPDSRRLAFVASGAAGAQGLWFTVLGSGAVAPVPHAEGYLLLEQWTPDGKHLIARGEGRVALIPAPGSNASDGPAATQPTVIFDYPYPVDHMRASPDGKWIAYTSEESGNAEVMVAAFPSFTERKQISLSGGTQPQWRADGRELFFNAPDQRMMATAVTPGEVPQFGLVRELFRTNPAVLSNQVHFYAAAADGQRFLMREAAGSAGVAAIEPISVVTNWMALLNI